jgi:hypothetical protein
VTPYNLDQLDVTPIIYVLVAYLVLQLLMKAGISFQLRRVPASRRAISMVVMSFWGSFINGVYFIGAAIVLHLLDLAPNVHEHPPHLLLWGLAGIPLGLVLWFLLALGRRLGISIFGHGQFIAAEDAILRVVPHARYIAWGVINLALVQPLGRELFMRGVLLPVVVLEAGWGWAVLATVGIELLLRLNIVWVFATLIYTFIMVGLYALSGNALCGLVAAIIAGLMHSVGLISLAANRARQAANASGNESGAGTGMDP